MSRVPLLGSAVWKAESYRQFDQYSSLLQPIQRETGQKLVLSCAFAGTAKGERVQNKSSTASELQRNPSGAPARTSLCETAASVRRTRVGAAKLHPPALAVFARAARQRDLEMKTGDV